MSGAPAGRRARAGAARQCGGWTGVATLLVGVLFAAAAGPAAGAVIEGRSVQALRCAAYIGMAAQYGYAEGRLSVGDRAVMTRWSVEVLEAWVPLEPVSRLSAYGSVLGELGSQNQTYELILRHSEWCIREFTPGVL